MRKILLSLFALLLISFPALAFSDNFDDLDYSGWIVDSGTWDALGGNLHNYNGASTTYSITHSDSGFSSAKHWDFEMKTVNTGFLGVQSARFQFQNGATGINAIDLSSYSATDVRITVYSNVGWGGFGTIQVGSEQWIRFVIDTNGSYFSMTTYFENGTVLNQTTTLFVNVADSSSIQFKNIALTGAASHVYLDDVTVSSVSPSASNSISWGTDSYVKDDSGSYSWTIIDSDWTDTFLWVSYDFYIDIYKNGNFVKEVQASSQTGTGYYSFLDVGTYQLKLIKEHILISGSETIANDSVVVRTAGNSYIHVNSTVAAGIPAGYQYLWGFTPYTQSYLNGIQIKKFQQDGTYKVYSFQTVNNLAIVANTIYSGTITFPEEGKYVVQLVDLTKGAIGDPVVVNVVFNFVAPTQNITSSWINIDQAVYMFGQDIIGDYGVDNTNFSNFQKYIRIQNLDTGNFALDGFSQSKQSNTFNIPIVNSQEREICIFGNVCFRMPPTTFIGGNNQIQLVRKNGTDTTILVYKNFTISTTNTAGYGLILSKSKVCLNEQFTAKVIAPTDSTLILFDAKKYSELRRWAVNGSNITIPIKISSVGNYELNLVGTSGNTTQITQVIEVADCAIATPTPDSTQTAMDIANLLSMNVFWAFVMTFGMMAVIGTKIQESQSRDLAVVITGVFGLGAFTLNGWVPKWLTFSIIIGMFVIFAWQRAEAVAK